MSTANSLWLLDTNIISGLMRDPQGPISKHLSNKLLFAENANIVTSVIVDCELRFGVTKSGSERLLHAYQITMAAINVLDLDSSVVQKYANLRNYLEAQGTPIGPNDMLIAAHALAMGATLVSGNEDEFSRIPGLRLENWLKALS